MLLEDLPEFLTVSETSKLLRCHQDTISAMARRGEIRVVRLGRAVRVVRASIDALKNSSRELYLSNGGAS